MTGDEMSPCNDRAAGLGGEFLQLRQQRSRDRIFGENDEVGAKFSAKSDDGNESRKKAHPVGIGDTLPE